MAQYNLPYHAQMPEQPYLMASHYHDNRMTSPPELGGWMDQSEGGGKFQLKRRRRCGQCGPCQVKDNCNKCQYCLRKDVLKQACIHRKCVYLRKPVPHPRPEISNGSKMNGGEGERGKDVGSGGGRSSSCSSTNQDSPQKPSSSTPSALPTASTKPIPVNPSAVAAAAAVVQSAELSSCQVAKTSFAVPVNKGMSDPVRASGGLAVNKAVDDPQRSSGLVVNKVDDPQRSSSLVVTKGVGPSGGMNGFPVNNAGTDPLKTNGFPLNKGMGDPLRISALEQHHSALLDAAGMLDSCRMPYMSNSRAVDSGRGPAQVLGTTTNSASCGFGMGNTLQASSACSVTKDFPRPQREQFCPAADQWGPVPYGYSHPNPWGSPPASYGVPSGGSYYPNPLGSSCQLGMSSPASQFAASSQPSFHHSVPFAHPDFSPNFHASAPAAQSTMTPPFYPPPMQIPSTLPNFPSFSQLPSSTGPHNAYTAAHPPMYPGSFYSSFRPPYEPQIYHVQAPLPTSPFSWPDRPLADCSSISGNCLSKKPNETDKPIKDNVRKPFIIFSVPSVKKFKCDMNDNSASIPLTEKSAGHKVTHDDHVLDLVSMTKAEHGKHATAHDTSSNIGEDLLRHLNRISGRRWCNAGNCDDFRLLIPVRSDECLDKEVEISSDTLDPLFTKAISSLTSANAQKHISECPWKRCQENKPKVFEGDGCALENTLFRMPSPPKCHCKCDSTSARYKLLPLHCNFSATHSTMKRTNNPTLLLCFQAVSGREISHEKEMAFANQNPGSHTDIISDFVTNVVVFCTGKDKVKHWEKEDGDTDSESDKTDTDVCVQLKEREKDKDDTV